MLKDNSGLILVILMFVISGMTYINERALCNYKKNLPESTVLYVITNKDGSTDAFNVIVYKEWVELHPTDSIPSWAQ